MMAADWIKMRIDLPTDPDVTRIAIRVGLDEFAVIGRLLLLWGWADRHSSDGRFDEITPEWIDKAVRQVGFARALEAVGWLRVSETRVELPNFDRHNGQSGKTRIQATERQRTKRIRDADAAPDSNKPDRGSKLEAALTEDQPRSAATHRRAPYRWSETFDGVKERGEQLGLHYSTKALGNCYTQDEERQHMKAFKEVVKQADKAARDAT